MAVTVSNVTINKTKIGPNESFVLSYDVINSTNYKIDDFSVGLTFYTNIRDPSTQRLTALCPVKNVNVQWAGQAKNTTRHYDVPLTSMARGDTPGWSVLYNLVNAFDWLSDNGYRSTVDASGVYPLRFSWTALYSDTMDDGYTDLSGVNLVDRYCTPAVDTFELQRATAGQPDDEGESLLLSAKLSIQDQTWLSGMGCTLYYAQGTTVDPATASSVDLTAHISDLLAGVTDDSTLITGTFSRGNDWAFLLAFGDHYETASASEQIFRAFANFHLSGAALGGAAFGRFSSADDTHPKLECEYPAYFSQPVHADGGIAGVSTYPLLASGATATDEELTGGKWIDGKPIYRKVYKWSGTLAASNSFGSYPSDIDTLVSGFAYFKTSNYFLPLNYDVGNFGIHWYFHRGNGTIPFTAGTSLRVSATGHLIIEYTKTTD